jgi:hypothetical protein
MEQGTVVSDWLPAGWAKGRNSNAGKGKICLLFSSFRPVLWFTQPLYPEVKVAEA